MSAVISAAVIGGAALAYSVYSGERAADRQQSANSAAKKRAKEQAALAEQDRNRANQKKPNVNAILASVLQSGGSSNTMLTGTRGVPNSQLTLGRNNLLGQ